MTISTYRTENILKAYRKQNKDKVETSEQPDPIKEATDADIVTVDPAHKTVYDKISCSLMDDPRKTMTNPDPVPSSTEIKQDRSSLFSMNDVSTEKKSILVVDDDIGTRSLVVDAICQAGDYAVTEASDGIEGLEKLRQNRFDLVICDVMMPGMNGMDLLDKIREIKPTTNVIIVTAYPTIGLTVSAMKTGAVDFLAKPFNIDDLLYKVDVYLRAKTILSECEEQITASSLTTRISDLSTRSYIYDKIELTKNNDEIFQEMVDLALKVVGGEACSILLYDKDYRDFDAVVVKGVSQTFFKSVIMPSLYSILKDTACRKEPLLRNVIKNTVYSSVICSPLKIRDQVFGIMALSGKSNEHVYTERDLYYIQSIANRASLNIENGLLYESLYTNVLSTFKSLVASIQARDHYTQEHSTRVMNSVIVTAEAMSCSPSEIESLEIAATLHDIGKISIPDNILLKPGRLTPYEFDVIKEHPVIAENILKHVTIWDTARSIIRHHHERWDGSGYPDGLQGSDIPFLSRILSVADTFDAMTNNRPYRKAMEIDAAIAELKRNVNRQFDEQIVDCFIGILRREPTIAAHGITAHGQFV
jgi:response regulator RpfG family c-di-GMP phosphodiesterase